MTAMPERPPAPAAAHAQRPVYLWLHLLAGLFATAVGAAAFAWPDATLRVVAILFGLNLAVTGFFRAGLLLFASDHPMLQRILGIVFGVLTGLVGILCLRNLTASLAVLLVLVAIGWLLDGLVQLFSAVGAGPQRGSSWQIATALLMVLGAITVLTWPEIGLRAFVFVGATVLVFTGIGMSIIAIAGLRHQARHPGGARTHQDPAVERATR
ncbi:DUF308 domain-containing protein [Actinoplanes sp. NPDC049316]|uniref:HdeD family acid-resistance protein n=1 Tax=Actinoplanes sp. NPDC049316 TaxID=3154727 RepID=UPI0034421721